MTSLLLHPKVQQSVDAFVAKPAHALLIYGSNAVGLAEYVSSGLLNLPIDKLANYPYFYRVTAQKNKKEIVIEDIDPLLNALLLKTTGQGSTRRVAIIEDAGRLNSVSQNRLLKALEEPPGDTVIILNTVDKHKLLPTVISRTQQLKVLPIGLNEVKKYYSSLPVNEVEEAWRISGGDAGLIAALLDDQQEHPLKQAIESAKSVIKMPIFERLIAIESLVKDEQELNYLLDGLTRIYTALHHVSINNGNKKLELQLLKKRSLLQYSTQASRANSNRKLLLTNLMLNL